MGFDHGKAAAYARKYALNYNTAYHAFDNDCTNFVSQAMLAGGWQMTGPREFRARQRDDVWWYGGAWFTRASYTWGGAQNFYNFVRVSGRGYLVDDSERLSFGDVVQMRSGGVVYHTMVVTGKEDGDLLLSYHTSDHLDEPLSAIMSRSQSEFIFWKISATNSG
ncbi:MAG: amidase domain-containing protein [Planctomycetota bacterium]